MSKTKRKQRALLALTMLLIAATGPADVVFFQGHQNGKVQDFDQLDLKIFQAQPLESKYYTEVWFHEMQFPEQGIIVIVNIQMHNLGISSGYCDTYITVSGPEFGYLISQDSNDPEQVKIDPQGFGVSAGKQRIELVGNTYRVRYQGQDIQGEFTYQPLTGSFQQGDGKVVFSKSGDFALHNFPIPWAKISGKLTVKGKTLDLNGVGSMNHDWQVLSPLRFMSMWRAFWLYTDDATVSMVRASAPDLNGQWSQRLMVAEPGRILFSSHDYVLEELDLAPVPEGNIPMPRRFRVEAVHGDDWLKGEIKVTRIPEKVNILSDRLLANLPSIIGRLAELVADETWSYRFWCDFKFEFRVDGKTKTIQGAGTGNFVDIVKKK